MDPQELMTIPEAAALLRLKPATLRAWILRRKVEYTKIGWLVRIRRSAIDKLIREATVPARP